MKNKFRLAVPNAGDVIRHVFLAWLFSALLEYLLVPDALKGLHSVEGIGAMSLLRMGIVMAVIAVSLWLISCLCSIAKIERWSIVGIFLLLACAALDQSYTAPFSLLCVIIIAILIVYAVLGYQSSDFQMPSREKTHWAFPVGTALAGIVLFVLICIWSITRVLSLSCPNYDFGIFSQMFYNMKETGLPITTVERAELGAISHFKVHVSPIYYLMLPFYCLFPYSITLQVLQAAVIASAVIPMWLIARRNGLSGLVSLLACSVLAFLPTTAGGAYFDLHENCFLLPLILWLMYAIERRSVLLTSLFAFLTLMVKEDAAVYVAVAALYLIVKTLLNFRREKLKELLFGIGLLITSLLWFKLVTDYLANQGDGVMTYRYDNFMYGESDSLVSVIFAVLLNPMKMLFECVDAEKVAYIGLTLLPLLGLPLLTRRYERYILLIPYILINLMSDYQYQHDIMFQYNFGSTAFLLYLLVINVSDIKPHLPRMIVAIVAAAISVTVFCVNIVPEIDGCVKNYNTYQTYYEGVWEELDKIPDDASVAAHTFYVVPLSEREILYDIRYCSLEQVLSTEYVVLKSNSSGDFKKYAGGYEQLAAILERNGYEVLQKKGSLVVYKKPVE